MPRSQRTRSFAAKYWRARHAAGASAWSCSFEKESPPGSIAVGPAPGRGHRRPVRIRPCRMHNPWYAGAYAYGRSRWRKQPDGRECYERLPQDQWQVLIRDAHPAYISWQEYERNAQRLRASAQALGFERNAGPPREGPALLQGRVVCGLCGSRMNVRYNIRRNGIMMTNYVCLGRGRLFGDPLCQSILGTGIDAAVGQLLVDAVTPMALQLALAVQQEITARLDEIDHLRRRQVERSQYEADSARHRYMQVDPAHRLVADSLEADWNVKLRALAEAQEDYQRRRDADRLVVDEQERQRILALASDFPAVWRDPKTPHRERKRMLALLIEDVTLIRRREITAAVRFRGGATTTLTLPRPLTAPGERRSADARLRAWLAVAGRVHRCTGRPHPQRERATHRRR